MKQSRTGASLFLFELLIGLLIFAFCAAVCTRIFVGAHRISRESVALSHAVAIAQNAAERERAGLAPSAASYDAQGAPSADGLYHLQRTETPCADGLTEVQLTVLDDHGTALYILTTVKGEP